MGRRFGLLAAALAAAAAALTLLGPAGARAAELVFWDNYRATPATIAVAGLDGSGGGALNNTGVEIESPEGLAYDPAANRLYVAIHGATPTSGRIAFVNLDGSGGGTFSAVGAPIDDPEGIALDPSTGTVYWLNLGAAPLETIAWARLDGSAGGVLNTAGATLKGAYRLALDPLGRRLYWGNEEGTLSFANLDGSGGGNLPASGATQVMGVAFDSTTGQIYWSEEPEAGKFRVSFASVGGGLGGEVDLGAAATSTLGWGLAFDPVLGRVYWGDYGAEGPAEAIRFAAVAGGGGSVTPASAPVKGPQDPLIIKSPSSAAAPTIGVSGSQLTCSQGTWAADSVSSFVYQAPRSFSFQWTLEDAPIGGATGAILTPTASGRYRCIVTATNQAGSSSRTSGGVQVTVTTPARSSKTTTRPKQTSPQPADLAILGKARHLKARPGKLLTLKVRTANQGAAASTPAKLCLKLTKGAKRALQAGRCQRLGALAGGATDTVELRLRVKRSAAPGRYKLRIAVPGDQVKVTVGVLG